MSRLVWYPMLATAAFFCGEPILTQGAAGFGEAFDRFAVACATILST